MRPYLLGEQDRLVGVSGRGRPASSVDTGRSVRANSGHSFGISQFLMDTLENRPEHINVVVGEVGLDNWVCWQAELRVA